MSTSSQSKSFERNFAVVIGINKYQNEITPLQSAVPDALAIAQILQNIYQYELVHPNFDTGVVINEYATKEQLEVLLTEILPHKIKLTNKDRLIFYFAGHGIARNSDTGPEGYLVPQNADLKKQNSLLKMSDVHDWLSQLECKHLLVVLDCCFAGTFRWASYRKLIPIAEEITKAHYNRFIKFPAYQVLTSASHNQEALDFLNNRDVEPNQKHSPFARGLIEALQQEKGDLNQDGVIIATELYLYLRDYVELNSQERQTPGFFPLKKHDRGEYLFELPNTPLNLKETPKLNKENNPYRGLEPFEEKHAQLFFGREQVIEQLAAKICQAKKQLTVVTGISGSGKSSLVKAGLVPYLKQNQQYKWQILEPIRPGTNPYQALARAISRLEPNFNSQTGDTTLLGKQYQNNSHKLIDTCKVWSQQNSDSRLLLIIDQFEELITMAVRQEPASQQKKSRLARLKSKLGLVKSESKIDESEEDLKQWQDFIELLATILDKCPQLSLVITLRSDFEPRFQGSAFSSSWTEARFLVPPMRSDELRDAVEKPAAEKALYFEPSGLVDRLVDEVALMPGALPLLSFTLSEMYIQLYQAWIEQGEDNRALTVAEDFDRQGGVAGALTRRANEEYRHLPSPKKAYRQTMRKVMLRMVELEGGEAVRRRVLASELIYSDAEENQRKEEVLTRLLKARLIVTGTDPETNEQYYEPAHDFLVKGWEKLQVWISAEQADLALQRLLIPTVVAWDREKNNIDLWDNNSRLDRLQEIYNSKTADNNWLNKIESEFLKKSVARKKNRQRRTVSIFTGVTIALTSLTGAALFSLRNAIIGEISSLVQAANASSNFSQNLASLPTAIQAGDAFVNKNFVNKTLLNFFPNRDEYFETKIRKVLYQSQANNHLRNILDRHSNGITSAEFSSDGKHLITASWDKTAKIWTRDGELVASLEDHQATVSSAEFSPDNNYVVTASDDKTVKVWTLNGKLFATLKGHEQTVNSAKFSPDNNYVITASGDGTAKIWTPNGKLIATIEDREGSIDSAEFGLNGKLVITSSARTKLWTADGELIHIFDGGAKFSSDGKIIVSTSDNILEFWSSESMLQEEPYPIAFLEEDNQITDIELSPNNQILVTTSEYDAKVWNAEKLLQGERDLIASIDEEVDYIEFDPDAQYIATILAKENTAKVWTNEAVLISAFKESKGFLKTVSFSPDARYILTASKSSAGKAKILSRESSLAIALEGHKKGVSSAEFSSDGQYILTASSDNTAKLWDTEKILNKQEAVITTLKGHKGAISTAKFSPDAQYILTASSDNTAKLWDTEKILNKQETAIATLKGHEGAVNSAKFSPDGQYILTASFSGDRYGSDNSADYDGTVKVWTIDGELISSLEENGYTIANAEFSPDGEFIVTASSVNSSNNSESSDNFHAKVWTRKGKLIATLKGHSAPTVDAIFSRDGKHIFTASYDNTVKVWNTPQVQQSEEETAIASLQAHAGPIVDLELSSDGQNLITSSYDGTARVWNTADIIANKRNIVFSLEDHQGTVDSGKFSANDRFLIVFSSDGKANIWMKEGKLKQGSLFATFNVGAKYKINNAELSPDENLVLTISSNGVAKLWNLKLEHMLTQGCQEIKNYLEHNFNLSDRDRAVCQKILSSDL